MGRVRTRIENLVPAHISVRALEGKAANTHRLEGEALAGRLNVIRGCASVLADAKAPLGHLGFWRLETSTNFKRGFTPQWLRTLRRGQVEKACGAFRLLPRSRLLNGGGGASGRPRYVKARSSLRFWMIIV